MVSNNINYILCYNYIRGNKLGVTVMSIRYQGSFSEFRTELEELGFNFNKQNRGANKPTWDLVREALLEYKRRNGNLLVKQQFVIPDKNEASENESNDRNIDAWPVHLRGIRLGYLVSNIRLKIFFVENTAELEDMGILLR